MNKAKQLISVIESSKNENSDKTHKRLIDLGFKHELIKKGDADYNRSGQHPYGSRYTLGDMIIRSYSQIRGTSFWTSQEKGQPKDKITTVKDIIRKAVDYQMIKSGIA